MKYLRSPSSPEVDKFQKSEYSNSTTRSGIEEQMAKMKKMIKSPLSKRKHEALNTRKTFGVPLDELLQRNSEYSETPYVLERITEYIQCYGMKHEGIFRVNGNAKVMEKLKLEFDRNGDADLENTGDVMSVAGLMKMFLRELPEPLIPKHFKKAFMQVHKEYQSDRNNCCVRMRDVAAALPEPRKGLLKFLCLFLVHISLHKDSNKMNANALAIVFSPNIFRCDGVEGFKEQSITNSIMHMFIEEYDIVFKDENEETPSLSNFIQVQEAKDNSFTGPPAMPIPYDQHKKLRKRKDKPSSPSLEAPEMISPYAEYRMGDDNRLIFDEESKPKIENHIYASVSKAQKDALINSTILSEEAEPYIRSNSPCWWHKPNGSEPSSPKMGSSCKSDRKEYMERTIKESIKEHLFGGNLTSTSEESDNKWDSPGEEAPPVPPKIPELLSPEDNITRYQKRKKRRGSKSSQENASAKFSPYDEELTDETDGVKETRHKHKSDQEPDQSVVRSPKRVHRSKPTDMESRQPLLINVVDYDSPEKLLTKKEKSSSNYNNNEANDLPNDLQDLDLSAVEPSGVLPCLTLHRAPLPRRRRPPSMRKRKLAKIDMKVTDPEIKSDLKQLPRKPPSPPPRPNLSPSNSISPAVASKLERRKRSIPELLPKSGVERDVELDSEGGSCQSDSPTGDSPNSSIIIKRSDCIPIIPPLELYKLCERTEDDPMVSPRERYDGAAFDDAMVSPRSRRPSWDMRGFSSECPPSPPGKQENHFWLDKKPSTSPKGESSLKELSKRAKSLKKKIKDFEEKFEEENGHKPTQAQDRLPIKKYVSELNRTQKLIQDTKEKRLQLGERPSLEVTTQNSTPLVKGAESLLTTVPATVEQSLEISLKKLKEKRESYARPENVDDMTRDQLQDEKLAVQKALLQHENAFGRPTSKQDKDIMKPLYDRYRSIKRKITNYSLKDFSDSPKDSKSTNKTDKRKTSPERPTDLDMTSVSQGDTLGSTASEVIPRLTMSLPARTSKSLFDNDMRSPVSPLTVCVDKPDAGDTTDNVDDPGGADDPGGVDDPGDVDDVTAAEGRLLTAKDPDAILHQASTDELLEQQTSALRRKKKLRKKLKNFEDNFAKKTGRKVQKEDRGSHEGDYEEYKKIKARLRLLDALITKQQGNSTI